MYACACVLYAVLFPPADQGLSFCFNMSKNAFCIVVQNSFVPFDDAKLISLFKPYNSSTADSESVRKIQKKFGTFFGRNAIFRPSSGYKTASRCYFFV